MNASQLKKYFDPDVERANIAQLQDLQAQNQQPVDTQDTVDTHEHNQNTLQENLNTDGGEPQTLSAHSLGTVKIFVVYCGVVKK